MREPEKQKPGEAQPASTPDIAYPKSVEKAREKASPAKLASAKKALEIREQRRQKALSVPIVRVAKKLELGQGESAICPFCGKDSLTLDGEASSFRCASCRKKGAATHLVKQVKNFTYWQAIAYLEELAASSCTADETADSFIPSGHPSPDAPEGQTAPMPRVVLTGPVIAAPEESEGGNQSASESQPQFIPSGHPFPDAPEGQTPPAPCVANSSPVIVAPEASEVPEQPASESQPQFIPSGDPSPDEAVREKTVEPSPANPLESSTPPAPEIDERIRRIKHYHRLEDVIVRETGVSFKRVGSNLVCRCPFPEHRDTQPSFTVYVQQDRYCCFGCGEKGDTIAFIQRYRNLSFRETLDYLDPEGVRLPEPPPAVFKETQEKGNVSPARRVEIMTRLRDFFHGRISESEAAKAFLRKRGLYSPELVAYFKLGFDDGRANQAITAKVAGALHSLGLINDKAHIRFYQCLTVGLEDAEGNVIGLYGRRVNPSKGSKHQLPKGKLEGIINAKAFRVSREMIITEGPIDVYSVWVMGLCNVSCVFSASSIPHLLVQLLVHNPIERVHLLLDNDPKGEKACEALCRAVTGRQIEFTRPRFPDGIKDANELLICLGREKASAYLRQMIAEAQPFHLPSALPFPSSPAPAHAHVSTLDIPITVSSEEITLMIEDRRYRVRGFERNLSFDSLKINLGVFAADRFHVDTLDLYNAGRRLAFAKTAAQELMVDFAAIKRDVGRILLKLEGLQTRAIEKALKPIEKEPAMSEREREEALNLLKDPKLMERIAADFKRCGLVGEEENSLITYLALTSRKLDDPLAVLIQARSGAGKTALMDAGLDFMPPEEVVKYTGVSGQSLYYFGENDLSHKILAISEDKGAEKATYPLKIMQSEKELTMASTSKDPKSGRFVTREYKVNGPATIVISTTAEEVDEELLNRFFVLTSNQTRAQTRDIHERQREKETIEGLRRERERERIRKLHQNAQRLLRALKVVNPYARHLTFTDTRLRTRRDHLKYLTLIRAIAFLHQYQREIKKEFDHGEVIEYIEVTLDDIEIAGRLMSHVLGTSLDELAPQTRKLLGLIGRMVGEYSDQNHTEPGKYHFTRRDVREYTDWGNTELKRHLDKLMDIKYLLARRDGPGGRYTYELAYKGEAEPGERFLPGLIDARELRRKLDEEKNSR